MAGCRLQNVRASRGWRSTGSIQDHRHQAPHDRACSSTTVSTFLRVLKHVHHQRVHHIRCQHLELIVAHNPRNQWIDKMAQDIHCSNAAMPWKGSSHRIHNLLIATNAWTKPLQKRAPPGNAPDWSWSNCCWRYTVTKCLRNVKSTAARRERRRARELRHRHDHHHPPRQQSQSAEKILCSTLQYHAYPWGCRTRPSYQTRLRTHHGAPECSPAVCLPTTCSPGAAVAAGTTRRPICTQNMQIWAA